MTKKPTVSELAAAAGDDLCDVVLYRTDGDRQRLYNLFNLISSAVTYGMVMNSARAGLGTANPVGHSLTGESLYYQALRGFSAFDWEFQRQLLREPGSWPLPTSMTAIAGRFPRAFADSFADEHLEQGVKAQQVARTLTPRLQPFEFRRLGGDDYALLASSRRVAFSAAIRAQLWRGTAAKLIAIDARACRPDATDVQDKLETMVGAFAPLCTVFAAAFDPDQPEHSYTRLSVYMPAYHTLHARDVDDPSTWYLERGLRRLALPKPVQIRAAELTHLSYLREADSSRQQAIEFEIKRDFTAHDRVTGVVSFGSLFTDDADELYGFDSSDYRDALYVVFRAHVPVGDGDSATVRAAKEGFNRLLGGFEVEARIHQLTLHLLRWAGLDDDDGGDEVLRPQFSLEDSKISFRAHRHTASAAERMSLKAAGFTCEPVPGEPSFHCFRDFWTWDRFKEFFSGGAGADRPASLLVAGREKLLEQVVGRATKAVLDHSIPSIEGAIDGEIARIATDYLERYSTAREVVTDRLHGGYF